jgi:hypothetical protein
VTPAKTLTQRAWLAVAASLWAGLAAAGTDSAFLNVNITLHNPNAVAPATPGASPAPLTRPSVCISETLSEQTNGMVRVVCGSGQFVSISPFPGKPFLGTHGGAFRYTLGAGGFTGLLHGQATPFTGAGTVTALRIYNANGSDGPLEMLVSF